eukprot:805275-Pyramimonas_sp.AAC.1
MRDHSNDDLYHDGQADLVGPRRAPGEAKARPLTPPPPIRPDVPDVRVPDDATEPPRSVAGSAVTTREAYPQYPNTWD